MLGRSMQTSRFTVNQAGTRPITFYDEIFPQNNQVLDAGYGQSTAGQVPLSTYKPYYPKIETVIERKITPQDIFRAQNKQVQKIVSAPNLKGYGNRFMVDTSNAPKTGKSDQSTQTPNPTQTRDQGTDAPPNNDGGGGGNVSVGGDDFQSAYGGSQGTVSISSGVSSDASTIAWLENYVNVVLAENYLDEIVQAPPTEEISDNRVTEEIKDDKVKPPEMSQVSGTPTMWDPSKPIVFGDQSGPKQSKAGLWNPSIPITFQRRNSTGSLNTSSQSTNLKRAMKGTLQKIPMPLLKDPAVQTSVNTAVNDIVSNQPIPVIKESIIDLAQTLKNSVQVQTDMEGFHIERDKILLEMAEEEKKIDHALLKKLDTSEKQNLYLYQENQYLKNQQAALQNTVNQQAASQSNVEQSVLQEQVGQLYQQNTALQQQSEQLYQQNTVLQQQLNQALAEIVVAVEREAQRQNTGVQEVATQVDSIVQTLEAGIQVSNIIPPSREYLKRSRDDGWNTMYTEAAGLNATKKRASPSNSPKQAPSVPTTKTKPTKAQKGKGPAQIKTNVQKPPMKEVSPTVTRNSLRPRIQKETPPKGGEPSSKGTRKSPRQKKDKGKEKE